MRGALALLLLGLAGAAAAQDLPATFRVEGVASRDVLNVRAEPRFGAAVLETLEPDAAGIEVLSLSPDGAWARVPLPEGEGWVARRFLEAEPVAEGLPRPLRCVGTEPFWTLTLGEGDRARLEAPGEAPVPFALAGEARGRTGFAATLEGAEDVRQLSVLRAECSDGMSDRPYGLSALLWDGEEGLLEGCCTLDAR